MDDETPPKRVTRSRVTAKPKTAEPEVKIATAASKAKASRNTTPAVTKRKTRADKIVEEISNAEIVDEEPVEPVAMKPKVSRGRKKALQVEPEAEEAIEEEPEPVVSATILPPAKATRGRPKKTVQAEPEVDDNADVEHPAPPKTTRGHSRKASHSEAEAQEKVDEEQPAPTKVTRGRPKKVVEEAASVEPPKTIRGRSRKVQVTEEPSIEELVTETVTEPVKKTTRGRPTISKATTVPKKSVKFEQPQEQDKENVIPDIATKGKGKDAENATGLRAKPVRKPAVSTRTTRTRAASGAEKQPLSPKKATQVATVKDNVSEDELATMEKTPMKPLTKSPVRLPGSILGSNRKLDFTTSLIVNRAVTQDHGASLMGSPARRPPQSPYKDALKTSPRRLNFGDSMSRSPFKTSMQPPKSTDSPFKTSLLQSPAKRPQSPMKVSAMGSPSRERSAIGATPRLNTIGVSRFTTTPRTLTKSAIRSGQPLHDNLGADRSNITSAKIAPFPGRLSSILPRDMDPAVQEPKESLERSQPSESRNDVIQEEEEMSIDLPVDDPMLVDEIQPNFDPMIGDIQTTTPPNSPPRHSMGNFSLRSIDQDPFQESDSEDELASGSSKYSPAPLNAAVSPSKDFASPSTPTPALAAHKKQKTAVLPRSAARDFDVPARSQSVKVRKGEIGFAPLVQQPPNWMSAAGTPKGLFPSTLDEYAFKSPKVPGFDQGIFADIETVVEPTLGKGSFFEDAMSVSEEVNNESAPVSASVTEVADPHDGIDAIGFAPTMIDDEDLDLAAEADEMSLIAVQEKDDIENVVDVLNQSIYGETRTVSEASQEYGDENTAPHEHETMPIDPVLLDHDLKETASRSGIPKAPAVSTPVRTFGEKERVFHTVSKVPLKPAGEELPLKVNKRSASVSRLPAQRPAPPRPLSSGVMIPLLEQATALTPSCSNTWSSTATPVRTPRRDINDQVLKGAVVYVDVHTTESADASAVFVELLGQMGAKCVKSWNWNPSNSSSPRSDAGVKDGEREQSNSADGSKVGITHVVFKDGGKRTLEKVRESKGIVLCVGVGWVLDCERHQTWLSESPYAIDTANVPRGGHRRRKSMEPRSIQNLNGTLSLLPNSSASTPRSVSASHRMSPTKEFLEIPDTPGTSFKSNRRKSTLWVRSPSSDGEAIDEVSGLMLSPVPATPAPETISAYAEHILDGESPSGGAMPYFLRKEELVQRTCPPKQNMMAPEMAGAIEGLDSMNPGTTGSGGVLMQRLLFARRKSLQWAPKVGSPLAKPSFGV